MSNATEFATSYDLILLFLSYVNWNDLMSLALVNRVMRCFVTIFIRKYVKRLLAPFIDRKKQKLFWNVMAEANAIVCGDFAMTVLLSIPRQDVMGDICDIIVPIGKTGEIFKFLEGLGYQRLISDDIIIDEDTVISCRNVFHYQRLRPAPVRSNFFFLFHAIQLIPFEGALCLLCD